MSFVRIVVIFRSTDTLDSNSKKEKNKTSSLSDDEPLYDTVASDEDYASIGTFSFVIKSGLVSVSIGCNLMEMLDINYILKIVYPDVVPMNTLLW